MTTAPTTNAPITVGLARLLMGPSGAVPAAAREEAANRLVAVSQQLPGSAGGGDGPRVDVEKDAVGGDAEDARELVRHDDHRRAQTVAQLENELVEKLRADRVET